MLKGKSLKSSLCMDFISLTLVDFGMLLADDRLLQ